MKIYTAFLFSGYDTATLHCTHKYIGEATPEMISEIVDIVRLSKVHRMAPPDVGFRSETCFGDLRVLLASHPLEFSRFNPLRESLGKFRIDEFPYNPHVTTNAKFVATQIDSYGICAQDKILHRWYF